MDYAIEWGARAIPVYRGEKLGRLDRHVSKAGQVSVQKTRTVTPEEFRAIRTKAGLSLAGLARVLRIADKASVHRWEKGQRAISGPITILMEQIDAGDLPAHYFPDTKIALNSPMLEPDMRVVIYAQDLSGRHDDGYYTKPDLSSALDIFFDPEKVVTFLDDEGESPLLRRDAEEIFRRDRRVVFYNLEGEKVVISYDPSS